MANQANVLIPSALVSVFIAGTNTLATIYSDNGVTPKANPTTTNALGTFDFFIADGRYDIQVSGGSISTTTQLNVEISDITQANPADAVWQTDNLNFVNQAITPATPPLGTIDLFTSASNKHLFIKDDTGLVTDLTIGGGGGSTLPGAPSFSLQKNSGLATFVASSISDNGSTVTIDENVAFKGTNPWTDVTRFGVRSLVPSATPSGIGLTASISSGSTTAIVSAGSGCNQVGGLCFVNGDGVVIYGAGAPHSLSTPGAPTITPSLAMAGTGTGLVTNAPAGSTSYCYKIVARNKQGGLTAASLETCIATGAATLGAVSTSISSMTRTNDIVTVTTSSPHGFNVGCSVTTCGEVYIAGSSDLNSDPGFHSFNGWWSVESAVDSTHFTFSGAADTRSGATNAATGGTAQWFNCNHVTWPQVTGAWEYYIYAGTSGTETLRGVSRPQGTSNIDLTWDDFGSPMMDNFQFPPFVPINPPTSATSNHLVTTIVSGAGTPTLVLANAASTSVASATIRFDNTPNILAAASAVSSRSAQGIQGGSIYFPLDGSSGNNFYPINSYLDLTSLPNSVPIVQAGQIFLNETIELPIAPKWYGDRYAITKGTGVSFTPQLNPLITVNTAMPGVYINNNNLAHAAISALTFSGQALNGGLLFFAEGQFNYGLERVNFNTGGGTPLDYMGINLYLRGVVGQSAAFGRLDNVTFGANSSSPSQDGVTHTPTFYCNYCGTTRMTRIFMQHRGIVFRGASEGGSDITLDLGYTQGSVNPFFTATQLFNGIVRLSNVTLDSTIHPMFALLASGGQVASGGSLVINDLPSNTVNGFGAGLPLVTGLRVPVSGAIGITGGGITTTPTRSSSALISGLANDGIFGADFLYMLNANQASIATGPSYSMFVANTTPAAPTCTVSAGGSVTLGTYTFKVVPVWWNGSEGVISFPSVSCTTTGGNQTLTISWPSTPGNPKFYNVYGSSGGGYGQILPLNVQSPISITTGTPGFGQPIQASIPSGGPTMLLPGIQGVAAPQYFSSGTTFAGLGAATNGTFIYCSDCTFGNPCTGGGSGAVAQRLNGAWVCGNASSSRGSWSGVSFGMTNAGSVAAFTPDAGITVTSIGYSVPAGQSVGSGCTTQPTIRVSDGTTIGPQLTLSNGTGSGALSTSLNYPVFDTTLRIEVAFAASGCTTPWGNVNVWAQFHT